MRVPILGFGDELVGLVPVLQQVGGLLVEHPDVVVLKHRREEVVDLPGHVQDVAHPGDSRMSSSPARLTANKTVTMNVQSTVRTLLRCM